MSTFELIEKAIHLGYSRFTVYELRNICYDIPVVTDGIFLTKNSYRDNEFVDKEVVKYKIHGKNCMSIYTNGES